jgi:hypothetical protein
LGQVAGLALLCVPSSYAADQQRWQAKQDSLFGATIKADTNGDPTLHFQPGEREVPLNVRLVLYRGQPTFALSGATVWHGTEYSIGTLLIGKDFVAYEVEDGSKMFSADDFEFERNEIILGTQAPVKHHQSQQPLQLTFSYAFADDSLHAQVKYAGRKINIDLGATDSKQKTSLLFVQSLAGNFDAVLSQFEDAAGLSNLEAQLSPAARYHVDSDAEIAANIQQFQESQAAGKPAKGVSGWAIAGAILTGAAQGASGQSDSPILDTANQQAAEIRAVGDANAARQQTASQARAVADAPGWSPQPSASNSSTALAANAASGSPSSTGVVAGANTPTSPGASLAAPPSDSASAGNSVQYLSPLPSTCVRQFWDTQVYNWLSLENDCGVPIYVSYIFNAPKGWAMNGSTNLAPGAHGNTGLSFSDINQAGGFQFYVCPANSLPVDANGNILRANVTEYQCKPQSSN